jgi:uncharacterized membrane protein
MDNEQAQKQENQLQTLAQSLTIMGPLPSASEFSGYEEAHPGTAERLLVMAEKEATHRQGTEKDIIKNSHKLNRVGQALAFILALLSIGAVYLSILLKQPAVSIVPAIIALTSLAAVFLGKNHHK